MPHKSWSRLDNAAKAFATMVRKYYSTFFRIELVLHDTIIYPALKQALEITLKRYHIYQMRVRRGFFWYLLESHIFPPNILSLCDKGVCEYEKLIGLNASPMWKVLVYKNRLAVEFSHIVTDGVGGLEFLKTLLCTYYELAYDKKISSWEDVINPSTNPDEEEYEYGYNKFFKKIKNRKVKIKPSFHYPDKRKNIYKCHRMLMPLDQMITLTRGLGVSISEYITALHLFTVQKIYKDYLIKKRGVVRDIILVNLRKFFPTKSLRNFFWVITANIDFTLGYYSFEEILKKTSLQLREKLDSKEIQKHFSDYVNAELVLFNRMIPRQIKKIIIFLIQIFTGESINTSSVSNLGQVQVPPQVQSVVQSAAFFPIPSKFTGKNFNLISIDNTLCLSSAGYIHDKRIEREMALTLKENNIDVTFLDW